MRRPTSRPTTVVGRNSYPTRCTLCSARVDHNRGVLLRFDGTHRYFVRCLRCHEAAISCSGGGYDAPAYAAAVDRQVNEGRNLRKSSRQPE